MDKIKNLVNPGSKKDDEVLYGSGVSDDPVHSGTTGTHAGQGTHFGSSRTSGNDPLSSSTNPTSGTSGVSSTTGNQPLSTSTNPTGSSQYDTGSTGGGTHGLNEPYASRMPGGFDDDASTTASVRSGVPGQTTHTGTAMTGSHDPSLTNKPLPREPSSGFMGSSRGDNLGGDGLTGHNYPDRSVGSSGISDRSTGSSHLGRDAAIGVGAGGVGAAPHHHHESAQRDNYAPETGRSFPLSGSSNTGTGFNFPSGQSGTHPTDSSTTAGPHSSKLANKADPRVDSDLDGSRIPGQGGYSLGTGATPSSTHQGSLGRDAVTDAGTGVATGGLASGVPSHGPESWKHDHAKHGHQYEGDPCGHGETGAGGPHFIPGPHATDTANRLDPHVAGGTETAGHHGQHGHRTEEAALAGGTTGAGRGSYTSSRDHHGTATDIPTGSGLGSSSTSTSTGASSAGPAPTTAGPHKSDMLNKLDPRVDSDLSKQRDTNSTPGSGLGSSTIGSSDPYSSHGTGHHRGQEAALDGAGLAGAAAYEGDKHHGRNEPHFTDNTSGSSSSANPYSSSAVDPRVGAGYSGLGNSATTGTGKDHHPGRDAGLGAGAGGLAHEAERHHGQSTQSIHTPSATTGSVYDSTPGSSGYDQAGSRLAGSSQEPAATKDHHYGRDAALGAGAGGAAYEAAKHHGDDHFGLGPTPQDRLAGSGHQPQAVGTTDTGHPHQSGRDHHLARDTGIGGVGLGAGAAGVDEHKNFRETGRTDPGTTVREHQHPGDSLATYPSSGYGNERNLQDPTHRGHHEKEALAGGAAAGGLTHHEHPKHDEKALEKEHSKQIKQHEKALAKEEKAHEKERAKHMAAIEKDQKKHEHEAHKHEHEHAHDGEKKKGGLLGFLHRDKPDKELKEEEAHRQATLRGDEETSRGAGPGAYSDPLAGEHGSQSGVHDPPFGKGITTHDAYGTHEGHNKLHKDPPGDVLGARGPDYQGHGNVS